MQAIEPIAASAHRRRLLEGMAHAVAHKGYGETTISDIVREAGVSRRTFYEHFETRADCLLALYEAASRNAFRVLQGAIDPSRDWQEQLERAMTAYLQMLSHSPVLLRTMFVDILGLGAQGLAVRRRAYEEMALFMLDLVNPRGAPRILTHDMAMAVVGGIHEWVLQAIEDGHIDQLPALADRTARLVRAVASTTEG